MDERKQRNIDPWDDAVYGTGNTRPPKNHTGLIAALLVAVIFLSGISSALGLMNIRLFQELKQQTEEEKQLPMSFSVNDDVSVASFPTYSTEDITVYSDQEDEITLNIQPSQISQENPSQEGGMSWQDIYEKNMLSVVSLSANTQEEETTGTGVIFSRNGYIVTNSHVLGNAKEITVLLSDDRVFTGQIIGNDPTSDLAVVHIEAENLTPAEFGNSDSLRVGDAVGAIGDPLGLELRGTFTNGIISAINRDVSIQGRTMTLLQTNAALNTGNSGGPLVNCHGQVIGINTMKISTFTDHTNVEGLGFAIPSTTVQEVVNQLIRQGYVSGRPTLGIIGESVPKFDQYYYGIPAGVYITELDENFATALSGLETGDIITAINATPITSPEELQQAISALNVGDTVEATYYRGGAEYPISLILSESKG